MEKKAPSKPRSRNKILKVVKVVKKAPRNKTKYGREAVPKFKDEIGDVERDIVSDKSAIKPGKPFTLPHSKNAMSSIMKAVKKTASKIKPARSHKKKK